MFHPIVNRSKQLPPPPWWERPPFSCTCHVHGEAPLCSTYEAHRRARISWNTCSRERRRRRRRRRGGGMTDQPKIIANSVPQNLRSTSYVRNLTLSSNSRQLDVSFLFLEEDYSVGEDGEESAVFDEP